MPGALKQITRIGFIMISVWPAAPPKKKHKTEEQKPKSFVCCSSRVANIVFPKQKAPKSRLIFSVRLLISRSNLGDALGLCRWQRNQGAMAAHAHGCLHQGYCTCFLNVDYADYDYLSSVRVCLQRCFDGVLSVRHVLRQVHVWLMLDDVSSFGAPKPSRGDLCVSQYPSLASL